jgi:hypothetical protein
MRLRPPPRTLALPEISRWNAKSPEFARVSVEPLVSAGTHPVLEGYFGTFVSGSEILFPGNGDRLGRRLVRLKRLVWGKP